MTDGAVALILPALRVDLPAIRALLVDTWHDTYDAILGAARVTEVTDRWHSLESLARELQQPEHAFLVAWADGELAGTASATLNANGVLTLNRLYVRPARQSSGFGTALLDACLAHFPQARLVRLEVDADNAKGRAFYARRGFAETGARADLDGVGHPLVCEKRLAPPPHPGERLVVRPVRDGDAQDLFGLMALCFADYPGCYVDPHEDLPDLRAPARTIAERGGRFWVVEDDHGRVGACCSVDVPEPGIAELHRVYVRPDLRRRGLAERLARLAEDEARARGAAVMAFWSDTRFLTAHRFYARLGYRPTGAERVLGDISNSTEYRFDKIL